MKKVIASVLAVLFMTVCAFAQNTYTIVTNQNLPSAPTWKGTLIGNGATILNGSWGNVAIGDDKGWTYAGGASNCWQLGTGSNVTDNSLQWMGYPLIVAGQIPSNILVTSMSQFGYTNGASILGINAGNILAGNLPVAQITNALMGVTLGGTTITVTNNLVVNKNLTVSGTTLMTGVASFTAVPSFNAGLTAVGGLTNGPLNVLPAGTSNTNGVWLTFSGNGTNYAVKAYPQ